MTGQYAADITRGQDARNRVSLQRLCILQACRRDRSVRRHPGPRLALGQGDLGIRHQFGDLAALRGSTKLLDLNGEQVQVAGIIPNKHRASTLEHQENLRLLQEHFGAKVWPAVPLAIVWAETSSFGLPVFVHAPGHEATLVLWEILDRVEEATNGK